ncbi:MAG: gliding motility-associated C-terminal domain-containing protein [Chitinophagaceae bacterium]
MTFCLFTTAQVCTVNQFAKGYLFEGIGTGYFFDRLPGGQYYFGGIKNNAMIIHNTDVDGNILWSKTYGKVDPEFYSNYGLANVDSNSNYFINLDGNCVGMVDANGNPVSARELKIPNDNVFGTCIGVLPNNNKLLLVDDQSAYGTEGYMLLCLSPNLSTILWNKYFSGASAYFRNFTIVGNNIYVTGENEQKGTILCFDGNSGDLLVTKTYKFESKRTLIDGIYSYNNGFIIQARYYDNMTGDYKHIIIRTDINMDVLNTYCLVTIPGNAALTLYVQPGGSFYGAWGSGLAYRLFYISNQDEIFFHDLHMGGEIPRKLINTPEGLTLFSMANWYAVGLGYNQTALYFTRADGNGYLNNCVSVPQPFQKSAVSYTSGISSLTATNTSKITLLPAAITASDAIPVTRESCGAVSVCDTISIQGNTVFCNNGDANFIARRNPGCYTQVNWTLSGGTAEWQKLNDSTLSVHFLQSGTYTLIAGLTTCQNISDTIEIKVTVAGEVLDLGADGMICTGNTVLLNARRGFVSYAWQDGSTDSTFLVNQPGLYYVEVLDACGNIFRDTVLVSLQPPIALDIGPDRIKCNDDTLHLNATAGFLNYAWAPSYNISSVSIQNVIVNPMVDTSYTVRAEKTPGCFVYDTVHITVHTSPLIGLGPDISLCAGDSALLSAGNNFLDYQWSNGNSTAAITVYAAGSYSIDASTTEGCHSYDTVRVLKIFENPVVNLNHDPGICTGTSRVLDAGKYSSYLWSNGYTGQIISVSNIGSYAVMVTDNNGCKGFDTAVISEMHPRPSQFLPQDTSLCSYGSLELIPLVNYQTYRWSNNSASRTLSISQPSTYWLEVVDYNGCIGKDTIMVTPKECMKGFFMPNAFTPNKDGKNDLLRPLLFGNVKEYSFTIYNRWGQPVFRSKVLSRGWDGNNEGIPQDSNVFVWTCIYQFEGDNKKIARGSIILIR